MPDVPAARVPPVGRRKQAETVKQAKALTGETSSVLKKIDLGILLPAESLLSLVDAFVGFGAAPAMMSIGFGRAVVVLARMWGGVPAIQFAPTTLQEHASRAFFHMQYIACLVEQEKYNNWITLMNTFLVSAIETVCCLYGCQYCCSEQLLVFHLFQ